MVPAVFAFSNNFRLEHCCSKGEKLQSTNHSTVTLFARFRGLSISQPSHKSYTFAGTL